MKLMLKIGNVLLTAVLVLMILAGATYMISMKRSPDGNPTIAGYKLMTVISGSMEPAIGVGDVIISRVVSPGDSLQEGDVITYKAKGNSEMLITHRVVRVTEEDGSKTYVTKGDNNDGLDMAGVTPSQVVALYRWRLPYFGYLAQFIRRPVGIALFVIIPGLYLIGIEVAKMWRVLAQEEAQRARAAVQGGKDQGV